MDFLDGVKLIKEFESFKPDAYLCPAGVPTIGYGATGRNIKLGMKWTEQEAERDMIFRVGQLVPRITHAIDYQLEDHELGALVSFVYNVGMAAFLGSTLLKRLNEDRFEDAPFQFLRWDKAKGEVLEGLRRRRIAEVILFTEKRVITNEDARLLVPNYYKDS